MNQLPPFISDPEDHYSEDFQLACLAWHMITTKTAEELATYLHKQKPSMLAKLNPHLVKCKAWVWLSRITGPKIRQALALLPPHEAEPLRAALNQFRDQIKSNQEGVSHD